MSLKNKMFNECILGEIEVLESQIDSLLGESGENEIRCLAFQLQSLDVSFEKLRHENSQELIYRYLASIYGDLDQIIDLVNCKDLIDPEIIVWIPANEICQVFGLQLKDLIEYVENEQLAMLKIEGHKLFNWSEIKNLIGSS